MAQIADIADSVVTALNGAPQGTFSQAFTARRVYLAEYDLKEMKDMHVTIVPSAEDTSLAGRGVAQSDFKIDVAIQKKLTACDNAEIDALMTLVQEIAQYVRSTSRFGDAAMVRAKAEPIYSFEHLSELRQFTSVITLTLRMMTAW